jgi:aryl-alcohol dehydrogenase-like predicted oxidoreductase
LLARKPSREEDKTLRAQNDALIEQRYTREDNFSIIQRVSELAEARGVPMAQISLAWMLSKPVITAPVIGATKPHHLEDAVAALSLKLTPEEISHMEEPYLPHPVTSYV